MIVRHRLEAARPFLGVVGGLPGAFSGELIRALQEAIEAVHERESVQGFVCEFRGHLDPPEAPEGRQEALSLKHLGGVPVLGMIQVGELHRVLEDLHEAFHRVAGDRTNVNDERIPSDGLPLGGKRMGVRLAGTGCQHVRVGVPAVANLGHFLGVNTAIDLAQLRPGRTTDASVEVPATIHQPLERSHQVRVTLFQVRAVLHREGDQVQLEVRAGLMDDLPAAQVGSQRFSPSPNGAQGADEMLLAELGGVEPDFVHGVVLPEMQPVPTGAETRGSQRRRIVWNALQILLHAQPVLFGPGVACYSVAEACSFLSPCERLFRQVDSVHGGFLFGHAWPSFPCRQHTCPDTLFLCIK
ncbi:hypothetical protein D3C78_801220 [compost metagenome]